MPYGTVNADTLVTSTSGGILGAGNASIMKNRIINGAMVISQYNGTSSFTPVNNKYAIDRWQFQATQASKFTGQQNLNSVTPPVGFANYYGLQVSSAYTIGAGDNFNLTHNIEGYNTADLAWGTANAKTVTLSFQVYSSLTGTFGGSICNYSNTRSYPFTYSIPTANTWTTISITVAGDTTGTWTATNSGSLVINFGLGVGSTYSGTAGSWAGAYYISATGAVSVVGTSSATFYITGVQLEVGSSATGFEYENYTSLLSKCQRYYTRYTNAGNTSQNQTWIVGVVTGATTGGICGGAFPVVMRANPTASYGGSPRLYDAGNAPAITAISGTYSSVTSAGVGFTASGGGLTTGRVCLVIPSGSSTDYIDFSAEL